MYCDFLNSKKKMDFFQHTTKKNFSRIEQLVFSNERRSRSTKANMPTQPHNNEWNDFIIIIVLHQITIIIIITCEWTDNQLWNVNTKVNLFALLRVIFRGPYSKSQLGYHTNHKTQPSLMWSPNLFLYLS